MIEGKALFELLSDQISESLALIDDEKVDAVKVLIDVDAYKNTASVKSDFKIVE